MHDLEIVDDIALSPRTSRLPRRTLNMTAELRTFSTTHDVQAKEFQHTRGRDIRERLLKEHKTALRMYLQSSLHIPYEFLDAAMDIYAEYSFDRAGVAPKLGYTYIITSTPSESNLRWVY